MLGQDASHQCCLEATLQGLSCDTKKKEDQLFIWNGNKAGERMNVFSFALRLENSRKSLLE